MTAGASWGAQLAAALTAAAFGFAASPLTLLYLPLSRPIRRITADFVATTGIALLFLLSVETGARGQLTLYCAIAYLLSVAAGGKMLRVTLAALQKKFPALFERGKRARKARHREVISPQADSPVPSSSPHNPRRAAGYTSAFRRGKGGRAGRHPQAD